ncbi:Fc.00g057230.m01.CDS01 [Cosmosporella sp. VM-42]
MPDYATISPEALPQGSSITFESSSFFLRNSLNATLPTPSEVVAQRDIQHPRYQGTTVHPPVVFEDLGLFVKYGEDPRVTIAEGQCLWALRQFLPQVPVPEIYGWAKEGLYTFLYMELMPGVTLEKRWDSLSRIEKVGVCKQLKTMVTEFHCLRPEPSKQFIGTHYDLSIDPSIAN